MKRDEKIKRYEEVLAEINSALESCPDSIAAMSTVVCILHYAFEHFFWTGFYRVIKPGLLGVGPYQGTIGCLTITFDRGVCGFCATTMKPVIVDDVSTFKGYIACDSRTSSEIVLPVFSAKDELVAVLDIDSTEFSAFDSTDEYYLTKIVELLRAYF